jgi:hypothetical protein
MTLGCAGVVGESVIAMQDGALVPQALLAVIHTFPFVVPKLTVMLGVPCPEATVAPGGKVQL